MRSFLILVIAILLASMSSGCVTGVTQCAFSVARAGESHGPPVRAWIHECRVGDWLVVETGSRDDVRCGLPFAPPMARDYAPQGRAVLTYRLTADLRPGDDLEIEDVQHLEAGEEPDEPCCGVREIYPDALPYRIRLERGAGVRELWAVPQALALPVTIAMDVALLPVYGIAVLWEICT